MVHKSLKFKLMDVKCSGLLAFYFPALQLWTLQIVSCLLSNSQCITRTTIEPANTSCWKIYYSMTSSSVKRRGKYGKRWAFPNFEGKGCRSWNSRRNSEKKEKLFLKVGGLHNLSLSWCQTGHHSLFPWIFSLLALILSQRKTLPPNISCLFEINSYREKIMKWCEHWYTCWLHSREDWQDLKR